MKLCRSCDTQKHDSEFRGKKRLSTYCKTCDTARKKEWREKNRERSNKYMREYRRVWDKKNPERLAAISRRTDLKRKYGLTPDEYDKMLSDQGGVCALCKKEQRDGRGYRLSVDHCHETGRVRGLLCGPCNLGLGNLGDNIDGLMSAIEYIRRSM